MERSGPRDFRRSSGMYIPMLIAAVIFGLLGLATMNAGKGPAGFFLFAGGCIAACAFYWGKTTPFVRAAGEEIIIRAALLHPAKVFKADTLRGINSLDADIVQLTFTGFEEYKINLAAISREDREPLLAYLKQITAR
ncbi:MAG: hypothetical protein NTY45_10785 [Elusimicrobia bacterium]|nr:hypothetical protein [Elusimicrobiota bacterium]